MSVNRPSTTSRIDTGEVQTHIDLTDRPEDVARDESIGELIGRTTRDVSELLRKEIELAKTELREEA